MKRLHKKAFHEENTLEAFSFCDSCSECSIVCICDECVPGSLLSNKGSGQAGGGAGSNTASRESMRMTGATP